MDVTNRYVDVNIEGELSYLIVNKSSIDEREKNRKKNKNEGILWQGNISYHWTLKLFMLHRFRYERFVIKNKQDKIPWGISICVAHLIFSCSRICWMKKQQKKKKWISNQTLNGIMNFVLKRKAIWTVFPLNIPLQFFLVSLPLLKSIFIWGIHIYISVSCSDMLLLKIS